MNPLNHILVIYIPEEYYQVGGANSKKGCGFIYSVCMYVGEFQVVNQHLLKDLTELGIWGEEMKHKLIAHHGSVQVYTQQTHSYIQYMS